MMVADASIGVELVLGLGTADVLAARTLSDDARVHVPHLFDVEVMQVSRRYWLRGEVSAARAAAAREDLADLPWQRHTHTALLERMWALRQNATAYDAVYLALAEALSCPL